MKRHLKSISFASAALFCLCLATLPVMAVKEDGALGALDANVTSTGATSSQDAQVKAAGTDQPTAQPQGFQSFSGYATAKPSLNVRNGVWGTVTGSLKYGERVMVVGQQGEWYKISHGGTKFVFAKYISRNNPDGPPAPAVSQAPAEAPAQPAAQPPSADSFTGYVTSSALNVRAAPWGTKVDSLSKGAEVKVVGKSGEWYKIEMNGKTQYVHSSYISKTQPAAEGAMPGAATPGTTSPGGKGWGGRPVAGGYISSKYGWRNCPFHGREFHKGVDIAVGGGTPVKSPGPGKVIFAGWSGGYGNFIKVQHDNGYVTCYAHLKSFNVKSGQTVGQGSTLGAVNSTGSSTGNHLHFEILKGGQAVSPSSVAGLGI